jgi:hypothetical protein
MVISFSFLADPMYLRRNINTVLTLVRQALVFQDENDFVLRSTVLGSFLVIMMASASLYTVGTLVEEQIVPERKKLQFRKANFANNPREVNLTLYWLHSFCLVNQYEELVLDMESLKQYLSFEQLRDLETVKTQARIEESQNCSSTEALETMQDEFELNVTSILPKGCYLSPNDASRFCGFETFHGLIASS